MKNFEEAKKMYEERKYNEAFKIFESYANQGISEAMYYVGFSGITCSSVGARGLKTI